ncbi:response regulator [Desulfonema ishimotonii]|uniref:Response regulator n=1 Tax=Desulfonema ishimotonii TaxID=45657 RepID=A0A401G3V4_9BACT|nr:response regulator [Desulfonema ishimotonii]GBC63896.1 response regulator [Desulfonema ishimotonii]
MKECTILLVDDEKEFSNTLSERLKFRGFQVRTASSGETAMTRIEEIRPAVVLLDVMMPGMNGLETLRRIKRRWPGLPVILLTGQGETREGMAGMRLGAFDYLLKPVNIEELIGKTEEAILQADPPADR